jgi:hypothetical protein
MIPGKLFSALLKKLENLTGLKGKLFLFIIISLTLYFWKVTRLDLFSVFFPYISMSLSSDQKDFGYEVTSIPGKGKGVILTRDFKRGEIVISEVPAVLVVDAELKKEVCAPSPF